MGRQRHQRRLSNLARNQLREAIMQRKGIILAGGSGTRLYPITIAISKQLLPIYDKPMIYYPLTTLMLAGIRDILVISTSTPPLRETAGRWQPMGAQHILCGAAAAEGLAQAFIIGAILSARIPAHWSWGHIFHGHDLSKHLSAANRKSEYLKRFSPDQVTDIQRYGVVAFDRTGKVIGIEEKPHIHNRILQSLGCTSRYDQVVDIAREIQPSARVNWRLPT